MKKWTSLLVVMLLLGTGTAFAGTTMSVQESSPFFDLSIDLPEGGTCEQEITEDVTLGTIKLPGATDESIGYFFTVAFSDLCAGRSLSEFSQGELDAFFRNAAAVADGEETNALYTISEMDDGVRAMVIIDPDSPSMCWALTVVDGYFIQMFGMYQDLREVSREDIAYGITLLDAVHIIPKQ